MSTIPIQRVRTWSTALRLCHWLLAAGVLVLLASGWLLTSQAPATGKYWRDAHLTTGYLLGLTLVIRIALLFTGGTPTDRWRDFLPLTRQHWLGIRDMLVFYASLGRAPLPGYYGHNPLWGPIYLLFLGILCGAIATGLPLAMAGSTGQSPFAAATEWLGYTLPEWHAGLALVTSGFVAFHILAVFLHDARGTASEISAMINGHKIFLLPRSVQDLARRINAVPPRRGGD
jgi:Ni/Fe-hydrogenase 1 B-type cytochrome subunit